MIWLDNLKKMKKLSELTTKEIAKSSGIPEPTLEKIFSGQTKAPKLDTMKQLVHFLGYTLDDLEPLNAPVNASPTPEKLDLIREHYIAADKPIQQAVDKLLDIS